MEQDVYARHVTLEVPIAAPPTEVWGALTEEINNWWLPEYRMVAPDSVVSLEPVAGDQLLERQATGGSLLWYTVTMVRPGVSLHLMGHIAPEWGGPATSMLSIELEAAATGTTLRVKDALLGPFANKSDERLEEGWRQLFVGGFKTHLEGQ